MKRGAGLWLLVALLTALALYLFFVQRGSGSMHGHLVTKNIAGAADLSAGSSSTAVTTWLSDIKPRRETVSPSYGFTREELIAASDARDSKYPLDALRELAEAGNSMAAKDLGDMLIGCRPGALQDTDDRTSRVMAQLAWARRELEAAKATSSPAGTLETLANRADALQARVDSDTASADADRVRCHDLSPEQTWQGFDWVDRAVALGYEPAMGYFVSAVERAFSKPGAVGRNPRKAMELRARTRSYMSQMMQKCDINSLLLYAQSMPALYQLSDKQRLAAWQITMRVIDISQSDSAYVERMKKRLEIDELRSRLSASQMASAKNQAAKVRSKCLGPEAL